jgi:hypothetical protein
MSQIGQRDLQQLAIQASALARPAVVANDGQDESHLLSLLRGNRRVGQDVHEVLLALVFDQIKLARLDYEVNEDGGRREKTGGALFDQIKENMGGALFVKIKLARLNMRFNEDRGRRKKTRGGTPKEKKKALKARPMGPQNKSNKFRLRPQNKKKKKRTLSKARIFAQINTKTSLSSAAGLWRSFRT